MVRHMGYPDVEMSEREFEHMLDLVDALDPIQLLRLQCKVQATQGDQPVSREADTIPPPPSVESELEDTWPGGLGPGV